MKVAPPVVRWFGDVVPVLFSAASISFLSLSPDLLLVNIVNSLLRRDVRAYVL